MSKIPIHAPLIVAAISVALVAFIVYLPALWNGFVNWDDPEYVYMNHHIRQIDFVLAAHQSKPNPAEPDLATLVLF
jgi:hypothetical protein